MTHNSNGLPNDYIAIDTNVFGCIARKDKEHILALLRFLQANNVRLLVDQEEIIEQEYEHHLNNTEFIKQHEGSLIEDSMNYWMNSDFWIRTGVQNSEIWPDISDEIPHDKVDATFVCVAFIKDRALITDDHKDILSKRDALKSIAERSGLMEADVISSDAASAKMPQ